MNKKGIVFTYISLLLLIVLLLLFSIYTKSRTKFEVEMTTIAAENMDRFIHTLEEDYFPAALESSTTQAIFSLENIIGNKSDYLEGNDATNYIKNALVDGVYKNCQGSNCYGDNNWIKDMGSAQEQGNMGNHTLESILRKLEQLASISGFKLDIKDVNIKDINIYQDDAWNLIVEWDNKYAVYNEMRNISWGERTHHTKINISITNFYSPVYLVYGTKGEKKILITKHPNTHSFPLSDGNLGQGIANHYFYKNPNAPNFLDMLIGDFSSDEKNGISSFINTQNYQNPKEYSCTDYNYFVKKQKCDPNTQKSILISGSYVNVCFSQPDWNVFF